MRRNIIVFISIILIFLVFAILPNILITLVGNYWYQYLFRPLMWTITAIVCFFLLKKDNYQPNYNIHELRELALIGTLLYIILYFLSGLLIGYSKSPISHEPLGFLSNFVSFLIVAIAEEVIRCRYIKTISGKNKFIAITLITITLTLLNVKWIDFVDATESIHAMVTFLCKDFLPFLITNIFLSYLVYREGIVSSLFYKIPFLLFYLVAPVLPSNNHALLCFIHSLVPLLIYFKIEKNYFSYITFSFKEHLAGPTEKIRFFVFLIVITLITLFTMGIFPFSPIVVLTGSMDPTIKRGDIVIYQKIDYEKIEIGEVIVYNLDKVSVIHRVKEIQMDTLDGRVLITKGDNNSSKDIKDVHNYQVRGKVIAIIPKAGYPTIWLRELFNMLEKDVDVETGD